LVRGNFSLQVVNANDFWPYNAGGLWWGWP